MNHCPECKFFHPWDTPKDFGYCRRRAPITPCQNPVSHEKWPIVGSNEWCGEFEKSE